MSGEIRSTYPCRSHSGNIQMNMVGVVVLASPPRDPIRSKRHNGRRLRALHTYSATTTPPSRSSKVRWSTRWDRQHDGLVLRVESICGQGFAYTREVEEERQRYSQTRAKESYREQSWRLNNSQIRSRPNTSTDPFYMRIACNEP
jgi:hypothetical protein